MLTHTLIQAAIPGAPPWVWTILTIAVFAILAVAVLRTDPPRRSRRVKKPAI